jgi:membrane-anchored protein YejM (alkaline phosphatase superfamily)
MEPPPGTTREQQRANLDLLAEFNRRHQELHPHHSELAARIESYELAFRMQAEMPGVVNIEKEPEETRRLYGIGEPETDAFGRRCLLARRLVEQGVRFVQAYASGWDSHDDIATAHSNRMRAVDKPIAGLLKDLKRRGLLDSTLVVWAGEFGRSPDNGIRRGGKAYGRDHNATAMTLWFAGGGVKAGHVIGATDEIGQKAVEVVHPLKDVHVTILHLLGLDDAKLTYFHGGRFRQLSQDGGHVIRALLA